LFLTSGDGSIRILDYPSLETLYTFKAHNSSSFCTEISPTGRILAVGGTDALLTLWDTKDWFCTRALSRMNGPVRTLSFSWCGGYLVSGGEEDRGVEVVHVETGNVLHSVKGPPTPVIQWSPKDYAIAYAVHEGNGGLRVLSGSFLNH
jgi:THO complex subunit 3